GSACRTYRRCGRRLELVRPHRGPAGNDEGRFGESCCGSYLKLAGGSLKEGSRRISLFAERAYPAESESSFFIIVVKCLIGCPYINPDPLSTPVPHGSLCRPVNQPGADPAPGSSPRNNEPRYIHGRFKLFAICPKRLVAMLSRGDRGDRPAVLLDYPRIAAAKAPADASVPGRLGRPGLGPLVGLLGPQPGGRLIDHVQNDRQVVRIGAADLKDLVHGSVVDGRPPS